MHQLHIVESAIRKNDKVYTGRRHNDILRNAEKYGLGFGGLKGGEQGFITNHQEFVSREVAAEIAYIAGQIKEKIKQLYSEDLY